MRNFRKKHKGFSLVEMMVVLVLMAILALGVMLIVGDSSEKAWMTTAMSDFDAIAKAVQLAKLNGFRVEPADEVPFKDQDGSGDGDFSNIQPYLSKDLMTFPPEYVIRGDYITYLDEDETNKIARFDFDGDGNKEEVKKRIIPLVIPEN